MTNEEAVKLAMQKAYEAGWKDAIDKVMKILEPSSVKINKQLDDLHAAHEKLKHLIESPWF